MILWHGVKHAAATIGDPECSQVGKPTLAQPPATNETKRITDV